MPLSSYHTRSARIETTSLEGMPAMHAHVGMRTCFMLEYVLENPAHNALWHVLRRHHGALAQHSITTTTSYCKIRVGPTPYRKSTTFWSSVPTSEPLPSKCTPNAPCHSSKLNGGRHHVRICDSDGIDYWERSSIPPYIVASFLNSVAEKSLHVHSRSRLLILDIFCGRGSVRKGLEYYKRSRRCRALRQLGLIIKYVSIDKVCDSRLGVLPDIHADVVEQSMAALAQQAIVKAAWVESQNDVVLLAWASPPCESYSTMNLGCNAAKKHAERKGAHSGYLPLPGIWGQRARMHDKAVHHVCRWLQLNLHND